MVGIAFLVVDWTVCCVFVWSYFLVLGQQGVGGMSVVLLFNDSSLDFSISVSTNFILVVCFGVCACLVLGVCTSDCVLKFMEYSEVFEALTLIVLPNTAGCKDFVFGHMDASFYFVCCLLSGASMTGLRLDACYFLRLRETRELEEIEGKHWLSVSL